MNTPGAHQRAVSSIRFDGALVFGGVAVSTATTAYTYRVPGFTAVSRNVVSRIGCGVSRSTGVPRRGAAQDDVASQVRFLAAFPDQADRARARHGRQRFRRGGREHVRSLHAGWFGPLALDAQRGHRLRGAHHVAPLHPVFDARVRERRCLQRRRGQAPRKGRSRATRRSRSGRLGPSGRDLVHVVAGRYRGPGHREARGQQSLVACRSFTRGGRLCGRRPVLLPARRPPVTVQCRQAVHLPVRASAQHLPDVPASVALPPHPLPGLPPLRPGDRRVGVRDLRCRSPARGRSSTDLVGQGVGEDGAAQDWRRRPRQLGAGLQGLCRDSRWRRRGRPERHGDSWRGPPSVPAVVHADDDVAPGERRRHGHRIWRRHLRLASGRRRLLPGI